VDQPKPAQTKKWRKPEIVDVGDIEDITTGNDGPLRDPNSNPPTYAPRNGAPDPDEEVDLE
jgi:hypothetical protein